MFIKIIVPLLTLKFISTLAQINGEFWWLNDKISQLKGVVPPTVKLEDVSEFETDESDKVVFEDNNITDLNDDKFNYEEQPINTNENWNPNNFHSDTKIIFPDELKSNYTKVSYTDELNIKNEQTGNKDMFNFIFPEENKIISKESIDGNVTYELKLPNNKTNDRHSSNKFIWTETPTVSGVSELSSSNNNNIGNNNKSYDYEIIKFNKAEHSNDKIIFKPNDEDIHNPPSHNLCTYIHESECNRRKGLTYFSNKQLTSKKYIPPDFICCVFPSPSSSQSYSLKYKRFKRSLHDEEIFKPTPRQRNILIFRKIASQSLPIKVNPTSTTQRSIHIIVTPENDYVDPYWNIKNSKKPYLQRNPYQSTNVNYDGNDYVEDSVVELPKPGLVGLYSDQNQKLPGWTFINGNFRPYDIYDDVDFGDDGNSFGYSTINPRLQNKQRPMISTIPKRDRPVKLSTELSEEFAYGPESYTVSYQSNPDFQVLQGFKLFNRMRNKSKIHTANAGKATTTEKVIDKDYSEALLDGPDSEYEEFFEMYKQVYKDCGNVDKNQIYLKKGSRAGQAEKESHPWLALVVLTKKQQSILCYATIVHPSAAVTAADCVYGRSSPGESTLIAGVWNLEDTHESQRRMVTIEIHPDYKPGELAHNLAMLHWKRPLRLGMTVQPACLADPHVGDNCIFTGWGGYDQEIRPRSQWQRASILTPRQCKQRLNDIGRPDGTSRQIIIPNSAFCATVTTRRSVTGIGGPLICSDNHRLSAVGVAVWRDNAVVLIPAYNWVVQKFESLNIN